VERGPRARGIAWIGDAVDEAGRHFAAGRRWREQLQPSGVVGAGEAANRPIHTLAIAVLGVPLVDTAYPEDVARGAASRKRWEFLATVQFTRVPGGTATSFNALARF